MANKKIKEKGKKSKKQILKSKSSKKKVKIKVGKEKKSKKPEKKQNLQNSQPLTNQDKVKVVSDELVKTLIQRIESLEKSQNTATIHRKVVPQYNKVMFSDITSDFNKSTKHSKSNQTIISFIGITGYIPNGFINKKVFYESAIEDFQIKSGKYHNMLPLVVTNFSRTSNIILIGSEQAIEFQKNIGRFYNLSATAFQNIEIIDNENDYHLIFQLINRVVSQEIKSGNDVVIDLTHGFRHIPILSIISIITKTLTHKSIKHILYAKEISRLEKYEIVDLVEYIDIANINYALHNFSNGYSLLNIPPVKNPEFRQLLEEILTFSKIMVGNLFGELFKPNSIANSLLLKINKILEESNHFEQVLQDIKAHLNEIVLIGKEEKTYKKYLSLAKIFQERNFYLNAIINLNEAVGHYFALYIRELNIPEVNAEITQKESGRKFLYIFASSSKNIFRQIFHTNFTNYFLDSKGNEGREMTVKIREKIKLQIGQDRLIQLIKWIDDLTELRNTISHGNLDSTNIYKDIDNLFRLFDKITRWKKLLTTQQPLKSRVAVKPIVPTTNFIVNTDNLNYAQTLKKLETFKETTKNNNWRIPNITELSNLSLDGKLNQNNFWSSSTSFDNPMKIYVWVKNSRREPKGKDSTQHSIFVNENFAKLDDETLQEKTTSLKVERKTVSLDVDFHSLF